MNYDPEAARAYIETAPPDVRQYVEMLRETIDAATTEIIRLRGVIDKHTSSASRFVVEYHDVLPAVTTIDIDGMRTLIRVRPKQYEFYLAEPLCGYSSDHRRAFHKQVAHGFSERSADDIGRSIWTAKAV